MSDAILYHLVDAGAYAYPLPPQARPATLTLTSAQIALERAYGYTTVLRTDDGLGAPEVITFTWRWADITADALEARVRQLQARAEAARWLTTQGRAATPISGGMVVATPVTGAGLRVADIQLILAPASTHPLGSHGGKVAF